MEILEIVSEDAFCNKTTWSSWSFRIHFFCFICNTVLLLIEKILNFNNRRAVCLNLFHCLVFSSLLSVVSWFNIISLILVEVFKLIVEIYWLRNFVFNLEWKFAVLCDITLNIILPSLINNVIWCSLQNSTKYEEDNSINKESDHTAHWCQFRSPYCHCLLLKFRFFKLLILTLAVVYLIRHIFRCLI